MSAVRLSFSLNPRVAATLRRRAAEQGKPQSQYLAELVEADERRARDELAAEGYRLFSAEGVEFAEAALPVARDWG